MKINLLLPCALGVFCLGTFAFAPTAHAAPKAKTMSSHLEVWPGQRTVIVLPLMVSDGFLTNNSDTATVGGTALATAIKPLVAPQLSEALRKTGKFSVTLPYKFDPLLRRAMLEGLDETAANAYIESPTLSSAQSLLPQFRLDQPGMVAQVVIESLQVGGTAAAPTVQLRVRGDLYEVSSPDPFRTITTTSKPFGGLTPEDRISAAATQAFADIAAAFVAPPNEFALPVPVVSGMTQTGAPATGTPTTDTPAVTPPPVSPVSPAKP